MTVIDIGGHHGELYNSMKKSNTTFSDYYIFEPFDESFEIINKIEDTNLKKYHLGISNQKGTAELNISNWETSNTLNNDIDLKSTRNRIKQLIYGKNQYSVQQKIKIDTLDNLFSHKRY
jgi:FkbM family methyltransferase